MADLIDHMTSRFLQWKLPDDFSPDGGVTFTAVSPHGPVGTNLLTYAQAKAMVEYMIDGAPIAALPAQGVRVRKLEWEPSLGTDRTKKGKGSDRLEYQSGSTESGHWFSWPVFLPHVKWGPFDSEAEAKAAAQADYERRILAALEPASGGVEAADFPAVHRAQDIRLGVLSEEIDPLQGYVTKEDCARYVGAALAAIRGEKP